MSRTLLFSVNRLNKTDNNFTAETVTGEWCMCLIRCVNPCSDMAITCRKTRTSYVTIARPSGACSSGYAIFTDLARYAC